MRMPIFRMHGLTGVYCAIHRETGMCYVGSASVSIQRRYTAHLRQARCGSKTAFHSAIRKYGASACDFEVLRECKPAEVLKWETFYIKFLNSASVEGFNTVTEPGTTLLGFKKTEVMRSRISQANKGNVFSAESRENMSKAKKGRPIAPEVMVQRLEYYKTHPTSTETRAKISKAVKGRKASPETIVKIAAAARGRTWSEAARKQMSATRTGRKASDETRNKMSQSKKGKPKSEETKRRMVLAWQIRKQKKAEMKAAQELANAPETSYTS